MFFEHLNFWTHSENVILYFFIIMFSTTLVSLSSNNRHMIVAQLTFSAAWASWDWYDNIESETCFRHKHLLSLFLYFFLTPPHTGSYQQGHVETGNICASVSVCCKELLSFNPVLCYSNWYNFAVSVLIRSGEIETWDKRGRREHEKCMTLFFLQKMCEGQ
jgi:CDP-diglyceride synthetase